MLQVGQFHPRRRSTAAVGTCCKAPALSPRVFMEAFSLACVGAAPAGMGLLSVRQVLCGLCAAAGCCLLGVFCSV